MSKKKRQNEEPRFSRRTLLALACGSAVATVAGLYFGKNQPAGITLNELQQINGVKRIIDSRGTCPDVIYLACLHPPTFSAGTPIYAPDARPNMAVCFSIASELYKKGDRSICIEGLDEFVEERYQQNGKTPSLRRSKDGRDDTFESFVQATSLLNAQPWHLYEGESKLIETRWTAEEKEIIDAHDHLKKTFQDGTANIMTELYVRTPDGRFVLPTERQTELQSRVNQLYGQLYQMAVQKVNAVLTPEKLKTLYDIHVVSRENLIVSQAKRCKNEGNGQLIVIYGSGHALTLAERLKPTDLNYAIVWTDGCASEPMHMTPDVLKEMYALFPTKETALRNEFECTDQGFKPKR